MNQPQSKRVLITGGSSGLGREIALRYAQSGHRICIVDINEVRGADTLEELKNQGTEAIYRHCDVTKTEDIQAAVDAVKSKWGGLDIIFNNAGIAGGGTFDKATDADWQFIMGVNFYGALKGCQAAIPVMKAQGHGHIVNIASMAGLLNPPGMAGYNVSKAAVVSLSETLKPELALDNIGVTVVCPSFFKTNLGDSIKDTSNIVAQNLAALMAASNISAADIAGMIYDAVDNNQFLLIPHENSQLSWDHKRKDLDAHLKFQEKLAEKFKTPHE